MTEPEITYESLQKDNLFLDAAYHAMRDLGYNDVDPADPKDIVDTFLENKRYFDTNLISTVTQGNNIIDLPDDSKQLYKYALDKINKMPDFDDGFVNAMGDYLGAAVTDPTNVASALAGFFTLGAGSAAIQAGKEAAKQTVKNALIGRIKSAMAPRKLISYAAEGSVAAGGAAIQEFGIAGVTPGIQGVNIDLGLQDEIDVGKGAQRVLLEGILSPIAGRTSEVILRSVKDNVLSPALKSSTAKAIADHTGASQIAHYLKNNLMPLSSLDETSVRLMERATNEARPVMALVEKLTTRMDDTIQKTFTDADGKINPDDLELINYAMGTSPEKTKRPKAPKISSFEALTKLEKKSPELVAQIKEFHDYTRQLQEMAGSASHLSAKGKITYKYNPDQPYARDVYEKFVNVKREDFEKWLKLPENQSIKLDLFNFYKKNKSSWGTIAQNPVSKGGAGLFDKKGKPLYKSEAEKEAILDKRLRELYAPDVSRRTKRGPTIEKQKRIPELVKRIYGKNFNPALRVLETTEGIVDSSARIRLASSLADSLLKQNKAAISNTPEGAALKIGTDDDMVPLVTTMDFSGPKSKPIDKNSPFILDDELVDDALLNTYVPKKDAEIFKAISDQFDGRMFEFPDSPKLQGVNNFLDLFAGIQGYLKKNKTVYSLQAQARNILGAVQYTIGSGNMMGLVDAGTYLAKASPERKKELMDTIDKLGLKGSSLDIGQVLSRIGELDNVKDMGKLRKSILNIATLGTPYLENTRIGKPVAKALQKAYVASDDMGKIASFFRERKRAEEIWKGRSDAQKNVLRQQFADRFGYNPKRKDFDARLLDEEAVSKAMNLLPVYSRIPLILEKARGIPIVGSFTAFPAENLRNKYNLFKLAGEELAEFKVTGNKALFKAAANRMASQAAVATAPSVVAYSYNQLNGTDKVVNAIRQSTFPWEKNHALIVREDKKTGKYYYTDMSYNMPDQYALDMIMPFMVDVANGKSVTESLDKHFVEMLIRQSETFLEPSIAIQHGLTTFDLIKAMAAGDLDSAGDLLATAWKLSESGFGKMAREMGTDLGLMPDGLERNFNKLYFGEDRKYLEDSGSMSTWLAKHGLNAKYSAFLLPWTTASKEREFNPVKNFGFAVKNLTKNADEIRNTGIKNIKEQLFDPALPIDFEYIAKKYDQILSTEFAAYQQLAELVGSYKEFMSSKELSKLYNNKEATRDIGKQNLRYLRKNLYHISEGKRLSNIKGSIFKDVRKKNPNINLQDLRKLFFAIEEDYINRRLSSDAPDPIE